MNLFGFKKEILPDLEKILINFKQINKDDRKIECLLPTDLCTLINENKLKIKLIPTNDKWFGVTNPEDEEIIRKQLKAL